MLLCYTLENADEQSGLENTMLCEPQEVRRGRSVNCHQCLSATWQLTRQGAQRPGYCVFHLLP